MQINLDYQNDHFNALSNSYASHYCSLPLSKKLVNASAAVPPRHQLQEALPHQTRSASSLAFCTNHATVASSGGLPTSGMISGTFAANFIASLSAITIGFSSTSSTTEATKSGVEGAGGSTECPLTSTTPTSTTAATNNPSQSTVSTHSSKACLWISLTYCLSIVSQMVSFCILMPVKWTDMGPSDSTRYACSYFVVRPSRPKLG